MKFNWHNPYPSTRTPVFARNIVSTSQPLAAQAGLAVLRAGGNAVDAAIATAATMALVEPSGNGLGSDAFAIVWDGHRLHGLNASGPAPAAWSLEAFKARHGDDPGRRPERGWDTVTVPGAVAGWAALHRKFGRLPFADLLAPAIDYAERGFALSPFVHDKWKLAAPLLKDQPGWAQAFLPHGRAPEVGERFVMPGAARALKSIAASGGESFYRGEIAAAIAAYARETGGALTEADLAAYQPEWVGTLSQEFHGHELHEIPPNGQGITALIALGILKHSAIGQCKVDTADWYHVGIEAMKLAFADVHAHVADARYMNISPRDLLSETYLASRAKLIDMRRAQVFATGKANSGGTIYLSTADESGMMVSFIQSNYMGFGSGVVVPGWGISLQNRGHAFSLDPAHPNALAPGKRPFHTIIPAFLTRHGLPQMSFGVMGGNMQPQGHVQTLVRMLSAQQQPQAACDAPRWRWIEGLQVALEPHMPKEAKEELARRGHQIATGADGHTDFGAGQFIWKLGEPGVEGYVAASDPRRDGLAAGY